MKASSVLQGLIDALKVLPGVGNRSAQRMAFHLLQHDQKGALRLSQSIQRALDEIRHCQQCNTLTETDVCETCADPRRDRSLLCIVESAADQAMIEASHSYQGLYFVLLGKISPLDGLGPNEIFFDKLMARVVEPELKEVVLATNFTTEGETTAHYLAKSLASLSLKVTRISRGVPIGSELEYVDASTIGWALMDRRDAEC